MSTEVGDPIVSVITVPTGITATVSVVAAPVRVQLTNASNPITVVEDPVAATTTVIEDVGPVGPVGPAGPVGPVGPPGASGNGLRFTQLLGDGFTTTFEVSHGFSVREVGTEVIEESTGQQVTADVLLLDANYVRVGFAHPPAYQQFRLIVST